MKEHTIDNLKLHCPECNTIQEQTMEVFHVDTKHAEEYIRLFVRGSICRLVFIVGYGYEQILAP